MTTLTPTECYLSNLAPSGRRSVKSVLNAAIKILSAGAVLETCQIHALGYDQLSFLRQVLVEQDKSARTIHLTFQAIRAVTKTALLMGQVDQHALDKFSALKLPHIEPSVKGKALSMSELKHCLTKQNCSAHEVRNIALIATMSGAGLRRSEIHRLRLSDLSLQDAQLVIKKGKGNRTRTQYLPLWVVNHLSEWVSLRGNKSGFLFCKQINGQPLIQKPLSVASIYDIVTTRAIQTLGKNITPHDLRRTYITSLLDNGVDISTVSKLAGHKSITTTQIYDKRGIESLKKAVNTLSHDV